VGDEPFRIGVPREVDCGGVAAMVELTAAEPACRRFAAAMDGPAGPLSVEIRLNDGDEADDQARLAELLADLAASAEATP